MIWIATANRLTRINLKTNQFRHYRPPVPGVALPGKLRSGFSYGGLKLPVAQVPARLAKPDPYKFRYTYDGAGNLCIENAKTVEHLSIPVHQRAAGLYLLHVASETGGFESVEAIITKLFILSRLTLF